MPPVQLDPQDLPSFNQALGPDHHRTVLPNLSYPSRSIVHIPWTGSSARLLFSKTTPPDLTVAASTNVQVPAAANICFDPSSVPDAFYEMSMLIRHNLSMIVRKLKSMKQQLFGGQTTSPSVTAIV